MEDKSPRLYVPYGIYDVLIENLGLTERTKNRLRSIGLKTAKDLHDKSDAYFLSIKGFGEKSFNDLKTRMETLRAENQVVYKELPAQEMAKMIVGHLSQMRTEEILDEKVWIKKLTGRYVNF